MLKRDVCLVSCFVEGDARDALVLSVPDDLEVLHIHRILAAREALYSEVAHAFIIVLIFVVNVATAVTNGFLGR